MVLSPLNALYYVTCSHISTPDNEPKDGFFVLSLSLSLSLLCFNSINAQSPCDFPSPPGGIVIHYVGTAYDIPTLFEAIAQGKMSSSPATPNEWEPQ
jgi:hypothetical protein